MTISPKRNQWRAGNASSEQLGAAFRELHERSALVQHQPAGFDRQVQASPVFAAHVLEVMHAIQYAGADGGRSRSSRVLNGRHPCRTRRRRLA